MGMGGGEWPAPFPPGRRPPGRRAPATSTSPHHAAVLRPVTAGRRGPLAAQCRSVWGGGLAACAQVSQSMMGLNREVRALMWPWPGQLPVHQSKSRLMPSRQVVLDDSRGEPSSRHHAHHGAAWAQHCALFHCGVGCPVGPVDTNTLPRGITPGGLPFCGDSAAIRGTP